MAIFSLFVSTLHSNSNSGSNGRGSGAIDLASAEEQFHIYGMYWTEDSIEFYVDDRSNVHWGILKTQNTGGEINWPFDQPFFFILNLAIGGDWGGVAGVDDSQFPTNFEIDYVRVFELDP